MTRLQRLHTEHGQSPWLDNLTRDSLEDGTLQDLIHAGIRGVTANPSIFAHAMSSSHAYTEQLNGLLQAGTPLKDAYLGFPSNRGGFLIDRSLGYAALMTWSARSASVCS